MTKGIPCNLKTVSENALATDCTVMGCCIAMKCAYLVNLSTTTSIKFLFSEAGRPSTKSILIWDQANQALARVPTTVDKEYVQTY